uniref:Uncharacterized protein n=1 Tax=Odontella aurita TaxID=265563 RepID=A0A6U6EH99_9STRA|mmetsp:Transcript_26979/g.79709  ORF Transcript_26979/g.79709 Transcript_26979/m.79709 type:complete len:229 (+) Transcript_26979:495-1181(+)
MCDAMGIQTTLLPFHGPEETKLFNRLILDMDFEDEKWAVKWCKYVDGNTINAKLPVNIRAQYEEHEKNRRIKDAVKKAATGLQTLKQLGDALQPQAPPLPTNSVATSAQDPPANATSLTGQEQGPWAPITQPRPMDQPTLKATRDPSDIVVVAGSQIGMRTGLADLPTKKRGRGERGPDKSGKTRKRQRCGRCKINNGERADTCAGRGNRGQMGCQYFLGGGTTIEKK